MTAPDSCNLLRCAIWLALAGVLIWATATMAAVQ